MNQQQGMVRDVDAGVHRTRLQSELAAFARQDARSSNSAGHRERNR
jgi:hypothetical protein